MTKEEKIARTIIGKVLKEYPVLLRLETEEKEMKAVMKLELRRNK